MKNPTSIMITGASSGIGEALARLYAAPGVRLALGGRDAARTESVAAACHEAGASAHPFVHDVTDSQAMTRWIADSDARAPLDLIIANAGISVGSDTGEPAVGESPTRQVMAVNVDGVVNTVLPGIAAMRARGRGQIAIMSSLASFIPIPGAAAYCASKAAVRSWGEALRPGLRKDGIEVSVICPGWVRTRMTVGNGFPMPMVMSAERAARIIRRGLARDRARIAFPLTIYALARIVGAMPPVLRDPLLRRTPAKDADFI